MSSFYRCRYRNGLVGSRFVVAAEEHLADENQIHPRSVRRASRCLIVFYPDAQVSQGAVA